ncbi:MAG TPA: hypothetical protein VEW25_03435 [Allosphingosinicella sp.]|nr:hypothetical protein [Allosphingosinicella sp.]
MLALSIAVTLAAAQPASPPHILARLPVDCVYDVVSASEREAIATMIEGRASVDAIAGPPLAALERARDFCTRLYRWRRELTNLAVLHGLLRIRREHLLAALPVSVEQRDAISRLLTDFTRSDVAETYRRDPTALGRLVNPLLDQPPTPEQQGSLQDWTRRLDAFLARPRAALVTGIDRAALRRLAGTIWSDVATVTLYDGVTAVESSRAR